MDKGPQKVLFSPSHELELEESDKMRKFGQRDEVFMRPKTWTL
jgi:hypothetical protein